jgi:RimJ/RimL family protein N-acetyltransferase
MTKYKLYPLYEFNGRLFSPVEKPHLEKIKEWRNAQMEILRQWKPLTDYNQEKWFQEISESNNQVIFSIMIFNKDNIKKFIGYCGLVNIDHINKKAELSFLVDPERTSKRKIYKEDFISALKAICIYGFNQLNLNKIFTETFCFRKYHIEILKEYGFKEEGVLRENQYIKGEYCDSIVHSILKSEFFEKYGGNKIEK